MRPLYAPCCTKRVDYEEYKIGKPPKIPLVKEDEYKREYKGLYKGEYKGFIDKRLPIDCAMFVAATLTSKEGSPP